MCVVKSNTTKHKEKTFKTMEELSETNHCNMEKQETAKRDDIDDIFVITIVNKNTPIDTNVYKGLNTRSIPKMVATPLPPLKPANIGKI